MRCDYKDKEKSFPTCKIGKKRKREENFYFFDFREMEIAYMVVPRIKMAATITKNQRE